MYLINRLTYFNMRQSCDSVKRKFSAHWWFVNQFRRSSLVSYTS